MKKLGRNSLCYCGSGKKFKKCCLLKDSSKIILEEETFINFISNNSSDQLLNIFSLAQCIPKNQSKLIRIESIQDLICQNLNKNDSIDYTELKTRTHKYYQSDYREDPNECSFSENITYTNGNNIVFTGLGNDFTNANQLLINSLINFKDEFPKEFFKKISECTLFLLELHHMIATELKVKRYDFESDYKNDICFPDKTDIKRYQDLFKFSEHSIRQFCETLNISDDVIKEFTTTPKHLKLHKGEETLLVDKPFLFENGFYYLVLPSAQMCALNKFIVNTAVKYNQQKKLDDSYNELVRQKIYLQLSINWVRLDFKINLSDDESIWQFDRNKFAYVRYLSSISSKDFEERANEIIRELRAKVPINNVEVLSVHIFSTYRKFEPLVIGIDDILQADYQIVLSLDDLIRIHDYWDLDRLSLWKFLRAEERAKRKGLNVSHHFTILTWYKWYHRNKESFFDTDETTPNYLSFDFSIQGEIVTSVNSKKDKHCIEYLDTKLGLGYISVTKAYSYMPVYSSDNRYEDHFKLVLERFNFPIWVKAESNEDSVAFSFVESIIYWLNEMHSELSTLFFQFGDYPLEIILQLEKGFLEVQSTKSSTTQIHIDYKIDLDTRSLELKIPPTIFKVIHRSDNYGERIIMLSVLKGLNEMIQILNYDPFPEEALNQILDAKMPLSNAKMIVTALPTIIDKLNPNHLPTVRYVYDADIAIVLEENLSWAGLLEKIPKDIDSEEEKESLLVKLIDSLINQLDKHLQRTNYLKLLPILLNRYEALLFKQAERDINITSRMRCLGKYEDVQSEYEKFNSKLIKSLQSLRCLIEFVVAEPMVNDDQHISDDDIDFMLAIMNEIINYGAIKDSIKFKIDNPKMGLLESGRLGVSHEFYDNVIDKYRENITVDELIDFNESFDDRFDNDSNIKKSVKNEELSRYYDKVDFVFEDEWGVTIPQILSILNCLSFQCTDNNNSHFSCDEVTLIKIICDNCKISKKIVNQFILHMSLVTRGNMRKPLNNKDYPEIFPWRYNRDQSYIRRPLLKVIKNNKVTFFWSQRHCSAASDNFLYIYHNGTLKVDQKFKGINNLLAERNNIKGTEFRNEVFEWLKKNTQFILIEYEVKIKEGGLFNADKNYGDIDVLAFDLNKKIIYALECKNTKRVKIMYDFHNDLKNYVNKQIPKHLRRSQWIEKNTNLLLEKMKIPIGDYQIKPWIISSYQVPVKYTKKVDVEIFSFNQFKNEIFNQ